MTCSYLSFASSFRSVVLANERPSPSLALNVGLLVFTGLLEDAGGGGLAASAADGSAAGLFAGCCTTRN